MAARRRPPSSPGRSAPAGGPPDSRGAGRAHPVPPGREGAWARTPSSRTLAAGAGTLAAGAPTLAARVEELELRVKLLEARVRRESAQAAAALSTRGPQRAVRRSAERPRCPGCLLELAPEAKGRPRETCAWCGFVFSAVKGRLGAR